MWTRPAGSLLTNKTWQTLGMSRQTLAYRKTMTSISLSPSVSHSPSLYSVHIVSTPLERLTCLEGMSPADRQRIWDLPRAPRVSFIVNFLRPARWVNLEADLPPRPALRHLGLNQHCDYCLMRHSEIETPAKLCLDSWCRETEIIHGGWVGKGIHLGQAKYSRKYPLLHLEVLY